MRVKVEAMHQHLAQNEYQVFPDPFTVRGLLCGAYLLLLLQQPVTNSVVHKGGRTAIWGETIRAKLP